MGHDWKASGLDSAYTAARSITLDGNTVVVSADVLAPGKKIGSAEMRYRADREGTLAIDCRFVPDTAAVKTLPRVGLTFRVPDADAPTVTYWGRGPAETYIDRNAAWPHRRLHRASRRRFPYLQQTLHRRKPHRCALGLARRLAAESDLYRIPSSSAPTHMPTT